MVHSKVQKIHSTSLHVNSTLNSALADCTGLSLSANGDSDRQLEALSYVSIIQSDAAEWDTFCWI